MTLEQTKVVDIIGTDKQTGHIILTITDAHDWTDEYNHLLLLQEKINFHLAFIESGEIYSAYPKSIGKEIEINVTFKYEISNFGIEFLEVVTNIVKQAGFIFHWTVHTPYDDRN